MKPKLNSTCHCAAYPFPHRAGGGKCTATEDGQHLCARCRLPAVAVQVDFGIGAYEYWGSQGYDSRPEIVSDCCNADLIPNERK